MPDSRWKLVSIRTLREEGDRRRWSGRAPWSDFYPRPPRGGRPGYHVIYANEFVISIHALREEGDPLDKAGDVFSDISIHALREEGDKFYTQFRVYCAYFYPRPPRGGRPHNAGDGAVHVLISIHALREEGDDVRAGLFCSYGRFLSTPSARRATIDSTRRFTRGEISIHALREEGDSMPSRARGLRGNFYPRPPRGGRQRLHRQRAGGSAISIHALREEGDGLFTVPYEAVKIFLSTPSARRATQTHQAAHGRDRFLSTPSARRATESTGLIESSSGISIHALREEGDM